MPTLPGILPSSESTRSELRPVRMFSNLSPAAQTDFNAIGEIVMLPKGAILFRENDRGDRVFLLCNGQVKLSCNSKEGKTLNLKISVSGDMLGLSAVISDRRFEVTAETLEPTYLKIIRRVDFLTFLSDHAEASMHVAKALSEEYNSAFLDARRLALCSSAAGRLASLLLEWGESAICDEFEMGFKMALTHDDLAKFTGTSRETVTRALGEFQNQKLIRIRGASIQILSPAGLAKLSA
jgi:CRP/FNR family transcriptional regulator, cyclic AMP receptor protein